MAKSGEPARAYREREVVEACRRADMAVMRGERVTGTQAAFVVVAHRPERGAAELNLRSTRTVSFLISDHAENQLPPPSVRSGRQYFARTKSEIRPCEHTATASLAYAVDFSVFVPLV